VQRAAVLASPLLVLGPLLVAAEEKPVPRVEPSPAAPLGQVLEWTSERGKPYWYRLPRRIDPNKPPNLLLMLHGTGVKWGWAFWNYPVAAGSFRGGDIVVAPEGMTPGQGDTFNFVQGESDGAHLTELIAFFRRQLPVGRVYLYGHSQGAFFAYWFAGEHPEIADGIVAHAGNVLQVKHPALAKEKVAIGILHGRADAVVPVDCALRSEKIYREEGYQHVKLAIVEGLTERSGHWPLPKQAGEMLEWLDSIPPSGPRLRLETAWSAIGREPPDLAAAAAETAAAGALLRAYRGKDRSELVERHKAFQELLEEAQKAHAAAVEAGRREKERAAGSRHGSWAAHFRAADRAFGRLPSWQAATRALQRRAAADQRTVARALALLEQAEGGRSFDEGLKALEEAFLAGGALHLEHRLESIAQKAAGGVKPEQAERLKELVERLKAEREEGRRAAAKIDKEHAAAFRRKHAAWLEDPGAAGGGR
jgi:predicted esterase